jgi:hypothetical protein
MIRKRTFKEFDLGQVPLPDNQTSTEYNSQSLTSSPAAIPSPGHWARKGTLARVRITCPLYPKSGHWLTLFDYLFPRTAA